MVLSSRVKQEDCSYLKVVYRGESGCFSSGHTRSFHIFLASQIGSETNIKNRAAVMHRSIQGSLMMNPPHPRDRSMQIHSLIKHSSTTRRAFNSSPDKVVLISDAVGRPDSVGGRSFIKTLLVL